MLRGGDDEEWWWRWVDRGTMAVTFGIGVALLAAETTVPLWQVVLAAIPLSAGAWWLSGALQRQRARDAVRWERRWARWRAWWRQRRGR